MRTAMVLIMMLVLLTNAGYSLSNRGSIGVDIIGSKAENAKIVSPCARSVDLEIIGSTTSNIQIGEDHANFTNCGCYNCGCYNCGYPNGCYYTTPWDDFIRPLCYPWSSYIPTRYNKPYCPNSQAGPTLTPGVLTLGRSTMASGE